MYPWIVFLHVASAFTFLLTHGASAAVAFRLRQEKSPERIRALLELSTATVKVMYLSLLLLLLSGIVAAFLGRWWSRGWIWASLGILIAITVAMTLISARAYYPLKAALGLPDPWGNAELPPEPASEDEIAAILAAGRPELLTLIGLGGWIVVLWLMMFKPF